MRDRDQVAARKAFEASEQDERFRGKFLFQIPAEDWLPEFHEVAAITAEHAPRILEIVRTHGWPGRSRVGDDGAAAAWLVLQHCGPEVQRMCLTALEAAVLSDEADAEHLACVSDRIELESGRLQIYATHLALNEAAEQVPLIGVADPDRLDVRRRDLGLEPWDVYVRRVSRRQ